jgi:hypothetical protein
MPKVLTRLHIDEISAVDKGAGEDCRIVLMKRDQQRAKMKKIFDRYFRPDGTARKRVADDDVLDAERAAATRSKAAEFVLHSREGHRLARRFPGASPSELIDLVCAAGIPVDKREHGPRWMQMAGDPAIFAPENERTGDDALSEGATHSDEEEFQSEDEDLEECEEDAMKNFEALRTVAKSATGMQEIVKNVLGSANACGLSKQEWDELLIDHAEATGKRLDALITGDRNIGECCDAVSRANGLLPTVF